MISIKATCWDCGDVDLKGDQVALLAGGGPGARTYAFTCPLCGGFVEKPATARIAGLLQAAGVTVNDVPAEILEPHFGPPVTYDEILDFHAALQEEDWFDRLFDGLPG